MSSRYLFTNARRNIDANPTHTLKLLVLVTIAGVLFIPTARALGNDSLARIPVKGGLEFVKNRNIRMQEEILRISLNKIQVKYRFLNESDQDVHSTVAFPMPAGGPGHGKVARSSKEETGSHFSVSANGRSIPTKKIEGAET